MRSRLFFDVVLTVSAVVVILLYLGAIIYGTINGLTHKPKEPCEAIAQDQYQIIQAQKLTIDYLRIENYKLRNE